MKALQIQIESARAIPGSVKVRNVSSACGSVVTYESATVVRQVRRVLPCLDIPHVIQTVAKLNRNGSSDY